MPAMPTKWVITAALLSVLLPISALAQESPSAATAGATAAKPVSFLGTVQTLSGNTLAIKNDAGVTMQVLVDENARLLRIEPGQKTLAGASPLRLTDLQAGDRVMARGAAQADGSSLNATMLVAIKGADIAQKQERDREEWQKNGTSGLVKAVDPAAGTVTLSIGAGGNRTEVVRTTPATVVRRYAQGSVRFDLAAKGTLDQIRPGDQLRARGAKGADGATLDAEEIVSGSFRNLAGPVQAVDAGASTMTVNDTATKKPVVITITPDSEIKKLEPAVAQRLASRMGGGAAKHGDGEPGAAPPAGIHSGPPGPQADGRPAGPPPQGQGGAGQDMQQLLAHAPSIPLKDLQKGSMVMVVATQGQAPGDATAITVVAGVEPMLQASTSESQALLSSSWNLGGGASGGEGSQ